MLPDAFISNLQTYCASRPIELVYLFGSYATDRQTDRSDIDFGIVFATDLSPLERGKEKEKILDMLTGLLHKDRIDVVDISEAPLALKYEIIRARHDLYVRSDSLRVAFEVDVLSRYLDYQYYVKRHTAMSIPQFVKNGLAT